MTTPAKVKTQEVVAWIQANRDKYQTKQQCFVEALRAVHSPIQATSSNADRYFKLADGLKRGDLLRDHPEIKSAIHPGLPPAPVADNGAEPEMPKRKYTKKMHIAEIQVNFCPNCGLDLHAVAIGMARNQ